MIEFANVNGNGCVMVNKKAIINLTYVTYLEKDHDPDPDLPYMIDFWLAVEDGGWKSIHYRSKSERDADFEALWKYFKKATETDK